MVVAGLTGGIATGKSTVSAFLASLGAAVIDADVIAREAVRPGSPAWTRIAEHFGDRVLLPGGELNRDLLGRIVFGDHRQKEILNRIVHPEVFREIESRIRKIEAEARRKVVICDVPLLIETGMYRSFEQVVLVYVPKRVQIARLEARDGISRRQALMKIRSQMPIEEKKAYATLVIDNSGSREETEKKAAEVYRFLEERSGENRPWRLRF
ncbi:MAG: dephospho-CoA kinase [Desulfomonilia bacterium]|jgi:dephospho-CoA kinase